MKTLVLALFTLVLSSCAHGPTPLIPAEVKVDHSHAMDARMYVHRPTDESETKFNGARALIASGSVGIPRALILSSAHSEMAYRDYARTENHFISKEIKKDRTHLAGGCAVNPLMDWAKEEMGLCRQEGLEVLNLNTTASGMDLRNPDELAKLKEILRKAQELEFTVLIHAHFPTYQETEQLLRVLEFYPKIRFILGRLLGRDCGLLKIFKHPDFFVDTSLTVPWTRNEAEKEKIVSEVREVGIRKFIFGSNWPLVHPAETLRALQELPFTHTEIEQIVYTNAQALDDLFN